MKKRIAFVCILPILVVGITQCNCKYSYNWRSGTKGLSQVSQSDLSWTK